MTFSAFLDACVLVPSVLRDLLLETGTTPVYRPLWSERIERETARAISRIHEARGEDPQESTAYVKRLLRQMNTALPDARVSGWEALEQQLLTGPDPNDRHVVAAAVAGRADVIVTFNLKDFPDEVLPCGLFAQHPDDFLCDLLDLNSLLVLDSLRTISTRSGRKGPRLTLKDLLDKLEREGLEGFAAEVHGHVPHG
ncbi:PIN domain-containing protein [Actinomyces sp. B33]|uniref:PIN domain-containing protein n=1 Tax=Actinomyces sp. B33 TaxID=2942131 RepID=UPI002340DD18|nr:PIN domain-containing protein [Actinomyces sp. B33]MDC4233727.1 PIN domain-containing protein [Actinomyces sp. B33]